MQPARLGALTGCLVTYALLGMLVLAEPARAQNVLETPQQTNDRIRALSSLARVLPHDYVIGNGDLLSIEVFDVKELSRDARVSQTGTIAIPLVPVRLRVAGLTEIQAQQKIAEVLEADGLVTHADVSVTVKEKKSKPITVVGAVGHPMVYQADRPVTLLEVLAEAGGVANDAGDTVIITRPVQDPSADAFEPPALDTDDGTSASLQPPQQNLTAAPSTGTASKSTAAGVLPQADPTPSASSASAQAPVPSAFQDVPPPLANTITVNLNDLMETGDTRNNILLQAGDVVTVPHAGIVYVLGAVARPGGFVLSNDREHMSTLKLLALAGGLSRTAKSDHAVIVRKDLQGQQHEVTVDLKKVLERKTEDVQLQPSDILYVPDSARKQALLRAAEFGIAVGTGVALYRIAYH
jgi:polysaccharide biosynthesis/export protein